MHNTIVKMKDGRLFCGPIWQWQPHRGYFTLVDEEGVNDGNPIHIDLSEVESAITEGQRTGPGIVEDRDELERAKRDGWVSQ